MGCKEAGKGVVGGNECCLSGVVTGGAGRCRAVVVGCMKEKFEKLAKVLSLRGLARQSRHGSSKTPVSAMIL